MKVYVVFYIDDDDTRSVDSVVSSKEKANRRLAELKEWYYFGWWDEYIVDEK